MKKGLLMLSLATMLLSLTAKAQIPGVSKVTNMLPKPILGVKIGGNFNQLSTSGSDLVQSYKPSFLPGIFGGLRKGKMGIRAELILNTAKYDYSYNGVTQGSFKNLYLDIPVLFEYKLIPRVWGQAGIQFSRTLSVSSEGANGYSAVPSPDALFNKNSYSGVLGVEVMLPVHLVLGARYILGFTDLHNPSTTGSTDAWHARTAQIYVGFRFI